MGGWKEHKYILREVSEEYILWPIEIVVHMESNKILPDATHNITVEPNHFSAGEKVFKWCPKFRNV